MSLCVAIFNIKDCTFLNLYAEYMKWFWFQKVFLYAVLECQVLCYCLKSLSVFPNNSTSQEPATCFLLVPLLLSLAWLWHNSRLLSHPPGSVYWQKKKSSERMRNEMYLSHCLPSIFRNVLSFFFCNIVFLRGLKQIGKVSTLVKSR